MYAAFLIGFWAHRFTDRWNMTLAIKANVSNPCAATFAFDAQKTTYGGKHIARLIEEFLDLLPATVGDTDAKAMSSLLVIGPAKGNRIIQILFAINYRFLGPNSR